MKATYHVPRADSAEIHRHAKSLQRMSPQGGYLFVEPIDQQYASFDPTTVIGRTILHAIRTTTCPDLLSFGGAVLTVEHAHVRLIPHPDAATDPGGAPSVTTIIDGEGNMYRTTCSCALLYIRRIAAAMPDPSAVWPITCVVDVKADDGGGLHVLLVPTAEPEAYRGRQR